jgi:hypothetical protein
MAETKKESCSAGPSSRQPRRAAAPVRPTVSAKSVDEKLDRFIELVKSCNVSVALALIATGLSEDTIRRNLRIKSGTPLTSGVIMAKLVQRVGNIQAQVDTNAVTLVRVHHGTTRVSALAAEHEEVLGPNGKHFSELQGKVTNIERIHTNQQGDSFSPIGFVLGCVAGLIVGIVWAKHNFDQAVTASNTTVTVHSWANNWWAAWLIGIGVFAIVYGLVSLFASASSSRTGTTKTTTTTKKSDDDTDTSSHRSPKGRYATWRANRRVEDERDKQAGSRVIDNAVKPPEEHHETLPNRQEANAR